MGKRVKVALFGLQKRGIDVDADATQGATVDTDLKWPDGSNVLESEIRNSSIVATASDPATIASTLWSLIQQIPIFIQSLASLAGTGIVVKISTGLARVRTLVALDARIVITNGDGVAGDPTVALTDWPVVKNSIETGEEYTVLADHQLIVFDSFVYDGGNLILDGDLIIL